jgi:hypothetical protein
MLGSVGVGSAVGSRRRWPALYAAYREACRSGRLQAGGTVVYQAPDRLLGNLATQRGVGRGAARLEGAMGGRVMGLMVLSAAPDDADPGAGREVAALQPASGV